MPVMNPIRIDPDVMGGTPCFSGTRVPIKNLFDYLSAGRSVDDFLDGFPTVTREQVMAVLKIATQRLTTPPTPAPAA
jgi:uncharacterized protein (DUF433 family)